MKTKEILSEKNPEFRKFISLLKGRGIKRYGLTFLSGPKQVKEVLRDFPDRCAGILLTKNQDVPEERIPEGTIIYRLGPNLFREIDVYGTNQPVLLLRVDRLPAWIDRKWPPGCTLFIPFQDPSNVGAVIRSAAAFGVPQVVVLKEAAHPYHHKSIRASGSALFRVPIFVGPSVNDLVGTRAPIITLATQGEDIAGFRFPSAFGLLPGLEGPGLPNHLRNGSALAIPMAPGIESINAALATGIALYLWRSGPK